MICAGHPGPGMRVFFLPQVSCRLSLSMSVGVDLWDLALDSCAQFLAAAEHKVNPFPG